MLKFHRDDRNIHQRSLRCRINQEIEIAFLGIVPMDDGTKYTRIASAMRLDDAPNGARWAWSAADGFIR